MAKKLKVELDVDTTKAKRKVAADLSQSASAAASSGGSVPPIAREMEKATRHAKDFNASLEQGNGNLRAATKLFGGMALRMATSYAANNLPAGSAAQEGVTFLGSVASGAMAGSAFGPWGAAAGAAVGAGAGALEIANAREKRQEAIDKALANFDRSEGDFANNKAFAEKIKGFTADVDKDFKDFAGRIAEVTAELQKYKDVEAHLAEKTRKMYETGDENAGAQQGYLMANRARQQTLQNVIDGLQKAQKAAAEKPNAPGFRASTEGLDALSRIGANFGGADMAQKQLQVANDQLATLKNIERKTGGEATWR